MQHLIENDKIIMSGIPSHFIRKNGEEFWGGYENMTELHYEDGWRDEIVPEINNRKEYLGEPYYDSENDVVVYQIIARPVNLISEKERLLYDLSALRSEISNIIVQIRLLNNDTDPALLTRMIPIIKGAYEFAKQEIENLTEDNILDYVLRGPQVQDLILSLKSML